MNVLRYNAEITSRSSKSFKVLFYDYGNSDEVSAKDLVFSQKDIPKEEEMDENILVENDHQCPVDDSAPAETSSKSEDGSTAATNHVPRVGDSVLAKWSEDGTWYNAKILQVYPDQLTAKVQFLDYGNDADESIGNIVPSIDNIPKAELNNLDQYVKVETEANESVREKNEFPTEPSPQDPRPEEPPQQPETVSAITASPPFKVVDVVVAKWSEDKVWYNAKVVRCADDGKIEVLFTDYGNQDLVTASDILPTSSQIPKDEDHDENVIFEDETSPAQVSSFERIEKSSTHKVNKVQEDASSASFEVGSKVFAKWEEDCIWYHASVTGFTGSWYQVVFTDYGNSADVSKEGIVLKVEDIPKDDEVDENVPVNTMPKSCKQEAVISSDQLASSDQTKPQCSVSRRFQVGANILAKWEEDSVWYRASVTEHKAGGGYEVLFTDYGNTTELSEENIVPRVEDVPVEEVDMIDENVPIVPKPSLVMEKRVSSSQEPEKESSSSKSSTPTPIAKTESSAPRKFKVDEDVEKADENVHDKEEINTGRKPPVEMNKNTKEFVVGDSCVARWSEDETWYNAQIMEITGETCRVIFLDYGNEDEISRGNIVTDVRDIPKTDAIDENVIVETASTVTETVTEEKKHKDLFNIGDNSFAMWSEDNVWYRAQILENHGKGRYQVLFLDYGNEASVSGDRIVKNIGDIPPDQSRDVNLDLIDEEAARKSSESEKQNVEENFEISTSTSGVGDSILSCNVPKTNFLHYVDKLEGFPSITAKKKMIIKNLNGPVGLCLINDYTLAVCCRNDNSVLKFSKTGNTLGSIVMKGRRMDKPTEIFKFKSGTFCVRDGRGLHMFNSEEMFTGDLGEEMRNQYYGVAEDEQHIITINCHHDPVNDGPGKLTEKGQTDIFYFDKSTLALYKRVMMQDVISEKTRLNSACRFLSLDNNGNLLVVDMMMSCVYCLNSDGENASVFGDMGEGKEEIRRPAGLAVDEFGSLIVVDSGNNRLQVVDSNWNFCGTLKVWHDIDIKYLYRVLLFQCYHFQSFVFTFDFQRASKFSQHKTFMTSNRPPNSSCLSQK